MPANYMIYPILAQGLLRHHNSKPRKRIYPTREIMLEASAYSNHEKSFRISTLRTLTWIEEPHFYGPGCSRCAWLFRPIGPPAGNSIHEMKENYMRDRDKEFAAHDCAQYPKAAKASASSIQSDTRDIESGPAGRKPRSDVSGDHQSSCSRTLRVSQGS